MDTAGILREIRDSQIRMEESTKSMLARIKSLESTRDRIAWGVIAAAATGVGSLLYVGVRAVPVLLLGLVLLLGGGCVDRDQVANLAATQWEAAAAIRAGAPADAPAAAIQAAAAAQLRLVGSTYAPAGVTAP